MVASEALGERGRTVKCSKCAHKWFQERERDSLDDLGTASYAAPTEPKDPKIAAPEKSYRDASPRDDIEIGFDTASDRKVTRKSLISIAAGALAALLLFGIVILMQPVLSRMPFMAKAYSGLHLSSQKIIAEDALQFDRIAAVRKGADVTANGQMINLSREDVAVSRIIARLQDEKGSILQEETIKFPAEMKAETSETVSVLFKNAPANAAKIQLEIQH